MLRDILKKWGGQSVTPLELYTKMFHLGEGELQKKNEAPGSFKTNPVAYWKQDDRVKGHYRIMFEDTFEETLKELQEADFAILNGITYFGRKNVQAQASKMYALIFDLDEVTDKTLNAFLSGAIVGKAYPIPNYIVLSGHGIHLYYLFEQPVPLYPNIKLQLKELKYALTKKMWNAYTSELEDPQYQGINQGFRVVGGKTKSDAPLKRSEAYLINTHPYTLKQLNEFVPDEFQIDESKLWKESKLTLEQAKKKYPEWYQKVVVNGDKSPILWNIKEKVNGDNPYALYDWWKNQVLKGASYHHRYFAIMCLAIYGAKNDKPYEDVKKDAYELIPFLNSINPEDPFTEADCESALECYDLRYATFPIKDIEKISGIPITRNKRNYRKQEVHLMGARAIQEINDRVNETNWRDGNGRKSSEQKVVEWRVANPDGKKADCIKETGLSKPTVYKWWNSVPEVAFYRYTPAGVEVVYKESEK